MAALTRQQAAEAFEHVLTNVFQLPAGSPLRNALACDGITTIEDLLSLAPNDIELLTFKNADDVIEPLPQGFMNLVSAFIVYFLHKRDIGEEIVNWTDLEAEPFNDFRISPDFVIHRFSGNTLPTPPPAAPTPSVPTSAPIIPRPRDLVVEFKRGIKRDIAYFVPLKQDKEWDNW